MEEFYLQTKTRVATRSVGRVQKGIHDRVKQVQVGTVCVALGGVNAKIALDTGWQPLCQPGSNKKYILLPQHMLKGFEKKNAPWVKKLAVHPDLLDWLFKWWHRKGSSPQEQAVVDLEMMHFIIFCALGNILHQSDGADNQDLNEFCWMTSHFLTWEKLVVSFPLYPLMKVDRIC